MSVAVLCSVFSAQSLRSSKTQKFPDLIFQSHCSIH